MDSEATPNKRKRRETDEPLTPVLQFDNPYNEFLNTSSAKKRRVGRPKSLTAEDIEKKKQKTLEHLKKCVTYAEHLLEQFSDIDKGQKDITESIKYFKGSLRPYQIDGLLWLTKLYHNKINGILADEMGLGKTIQIIALFCFLFEKKVKGPHLIVVPLSTLCNWLSEFGKFAPSLPVIKLHGDAKERKEQILSFKTQKHYLEKVAVGPIVICTYEIISLESNFFDQHSWQYIVVDEGHRIKNSDSLLSRELRRLKSEYRLLLTGTPLQNDLKELWSLFLFLMPAVFKDMAYFTAVLELEDLKDKSKLFEDEATNHTVGTIHKVLAPFMLRREKKFVLNDIPPKKEIIINCPLTQMQSYLYRAMLEKDKKKLMMDGANLGRKAKRLASKETKENVSESGRKIIYKTHNIPVNCPDGPYVINFSMQAPVVMLREIVNHPYLIWFPVKSDKKKMELLITEDIVKQSGKFLVLDAMLPKLLAGGHKVLIFSTLVMLLDLVEEMMILREYNYRRLDGGVKYAERNEAINDFMTDANVSIFLISTRAGGLGLNLTAADTVIFMDRDWNPMVDIQAQDRCHRIGQDKPVMVYSLVTKGTVDELILDRGTMKKQLEEIVIQEGKYSSLKKNFTDDEVKVLQQLLNRQEKHTKIYPNGLTYTDKEFEAILDRTSM